MFSTLIKKKLLFVLLAIILVFTGGLALSSADTSEITVDSGSTSQNELSLERLDFLAESTTDNNSVYLLAEEEPENETAGPTDRQKAIWQEDLEKKGPPPWAAARKKDPDNEWFNSERQGPPPWAGPKAEEKAEWQDLEQEGPPPWAGPKKNLDEDWFNGERQSPPPWAGPKKDKPE